MPPGTPQQPGAVPPGAPQQPGAVPPGTPQQPGAYPYPPPYQQYPYPNPYPYGAYPYGTYPYPYPYYAPPQYYPASQLPPPLPRVRYSTPMMGVGIAMVTLGAIAALTGVVISAQASSRYQYYGPGGYLQSRQPDEGMKNAGIVVGVLGGIVLAGGIPIWVIGGRMVAAKKPADSPAPDDAPATEPARPTAVLRVGPAGASLQMAF